MTIDAKQDHALLDRRTLLRAGAAAAVAAPLGVIGAQAFPLRAAPPPIDFSQFPALPGRFRKRRRSPAPRES